MNYINIATLINIIGAAFVARMWGWVGVIAYVITFIVLSVVFK